MKDIPDQFLEKLEALEEEFEGFIDRTEKIPISSVTAYNNLVEQIDSENAKNIQQLALNKTLKREKHENDIVDNSSSDSDSTDVQQKL